MKRGKTKINIESVSNTKNFGELLIRNKDKKEPEKFWAGIIPKSVGFIFGPAKSGKTIVCENLAFAIVSGRDRFLGISIEIKKSKILYISMEEDTDMRMIQRGRKQIRGFSRDEKELIKENLSYSDINFIRSVENEKHWDLLEDEIKSFHSNLIFIDSTNRFNIDIQEKLEANSMMQKFRYLAEKYNCAIVLIHHTIKSQENKPMTLNTMSGSSALSRDADFFIGVNRLTNGLRYIKFVESRYYQFNDKAKVISIQENGLIDLQSEEYESELLKTIDGRYNKDNSEMILEFIKESVGSENVFETKLLHNHFVETNGLITKKTLYNQLNKLRSMSLIEKISQGKYKLIKK